MSVVATADALGAAAFGGSPTPMLQVDARARVIRWNPAADRLFALGSHDAGRTCGAALGCWYTTVGTCGDHGCPGCPVRALIATALKQGTAGPDLVQLRLRRRGALASFDARISATRVESDHASALLFVEPETALAGGPAAALGDASHELRTPLNAILGYAQLLLRDHADRGDDTSARLQGILEAGGRLQRLIATALAAQAPVPTGGPQVLVVEDDEGNRQLLAEVLAEAGFAVRDAGDARRALALAAQWPPALAIVDLHLPGMDGATLAARLRALPGCSRLAVAAISGDIAAADADAFCAVLAKPYRVDELVAVVRRLTAALVQPAGALVTGALAALPAALRDDLRTAAIAARCDRLERLATAVAAVLPAQEAGYRTAVAAFRYDAILAALEDA